MSRNLPKRLYLEGLSYRYHPPGGGKKINLGRDHSIAISRYYLLTKTDPTPPADPVSMVKKAWARHRRTSKGRRIEFSISEEYILQLAEKNNYRCEVTMLSFKEEKPAGLRIRPWLPSIDRINSKRGYIPGNVRVVCAFVNVAMNGFGDQFFKAVLNPLIEAEVEARLAEKRISIPNLEFFPAPEVPNNQK